MKLRYATRIATLLILSGLIWLNHYLALKGQAGGQRVIEDSVIYSAIDRALGSSPHREAVEVRASGSLWSLSVGWFRLSDPLAVLGELAVSKVVLPAFLVSGLIVALATLVAGRAFCGWVCPMGLLGDAVTALRRGLLRIGVRPFDWRLTPHVRWAILIAGLLFGLFFSARFFFWFYPPRVLSDLLRDALVDRIETGAVIFIGLLLLIELLFAKRVWCRSLCQGGAIYSGLGTARLWRVSRNADACSGCLKCDGVCPYQLEPSHKPIGGDCDNCGLCITSCDSKALKYTFGRGRRIRATGRSLALAACLCLAVLHPTPAWAHHIKGIPHYTYSENYPQAPAFEESRTVGDYELRFTFFALPGTTTADLALYVLDTRTDQPYAGTVRMGVYGQHEDPSEAHEAVAYRNKNNIYKNGWVYEEDGLYTVRVRFVGRTGEIVELFRIQVGQPDVQWGVLGTIAGGVLALIAIVAIMNRRRGSSTGEGEAVEARA